MAIDRQDREDVVRDVILKLALVAVGVAAVVGIGTWAMVEALGLDDTTAGSTIGGTVEPVQPLPSTALPVPSDSIPGATDEPAPVPSTPPSGELQLSASPPTVGPGQRINLTGSWAGQDNVSLSVQRLQDGQWSDFGVQASVRVGTFETWVQTSRVGEHRFRVVHGPSDTASNPVTVTVG